MIAIKIDSPANIRQGEEIDLVKLNEFIQSVLPDFEPVVEIAQFPGGYSNLTYLLKTVNKGYVLRRPPFGAKEIKGGHDMGREYKILSALQNSGYQKIPEPVIYTEDESVMGCPFYIMERVEGIILRAKDAPKLMGNISPEMMRRMSEALCDNLVELHAINIEATSPGQPALINIGKPEGYIQRQVEGWHNRYRVSQTDEIPAMDNLADWLKTNLPAEGKPTLIHNDYKYDNLVLNAENWSDILAVLDWEMTTVGDPLMDLGTTLSYWAEANDGMFEKGFNLSWLPGNLTRQEFADRYAEKSGRSVSNILYFYVFGLFKNSVVIQQIYSRYRKGLTKDERFADLIYGVKALSKKGVNSIEKGRML
ncbi:phosphotransferase family protein [Emticicia sp. BO119]|uniref:phosphotransferase family protein n=1 Tax=Emticicia sp. BO119 TaxID=2757768 RepID=UPI0015F09CD2|nr:phosphotransferase family protein [Emticicia sp. BO119]MBA4850776.1 phosphotransferase family protein [Emticicia sp. BO119]